MLSIFILVRTRYVRYFMAIWYMFFIYIYIGGGGVEVLQCLS